MGGQDREAESKDHDVEMQDDATLSLPPTLQANGKRQKSDNTSLHTSNPNAVSQTAPSEASSVTDSLLPSTSTTTTAATSIAEPMEAFSRPSYDEQVVKVRELIERKPQDKSKGFVVSGKWLRRVQARSSYPPEGIVEKSATEGDVGSLDNSDIAMVGEDSGSLKDEAGETFTFLRPGLMFGEDLQVLPVEAWDLVIQWYGLAKTSPIITRFAHAVNEEDVQYELYPPVFSFLKVPGTYTQQVQKDSDMLPPRMLSSVHTNYMKWLQNAKQLVHTDINTKVRVWRILGGIKSTSASGILTPIASRSASPAPGAEIVASAGSKMIIDVQSFVTLQQGDQRQLIEHKDHTMDSNYNGNIDLRTIGLGKSDVIVLEEQGPTGDEFPSEHVKFSIKGAAKAKNLTVNGRSSPIPSMMTRGRAQREGGKPKGIVGLTNLGNTCYMNSALQCIRSVDELTEYFRCGYFKKELNVGNPLGHHGEVAKAYGSFIDNVYTSSSSFSPQAFKRVVGKYGGQFSGYGQQDSQEFLAFLLDGLQEDLNRIVKKPYIEKPDSTDEMVNNPVALKEFADRNWNDYKARNDSVVTDLFAGMYKSTVTCPVCDKVSIVFDPFSNVTLQLPIENNWSKEIIYFPLYSRPVKVDVDIDKNASILDMKKFIGQRVNCPAERMICAESYKNKFFKVFDNTEVIAETSINTNDVICMYELEAKPTNYNPDKQKKFSTFSYSSRDPDPKVDADSPAADQLLAPIYHRVARPNGNNRMIRSFFGHPSYVVLSRDDRASYNALLKKIIAQVVGMTTLDILKEGVNIESSNATPEDSDTLVISEAGSNNSQSPSASAQSLQGEDGMVDVSMRDAIQASEDDPSDRHMAIKHLLKPNARVPKQLDSLFEIKVAHGDEGLATGWNTFNESSDYVSVRERAEKLSKAIPHRPKRSIEEENYDSSADELSDIPHVAPRSPESGSESGASDRPSSDTESVELPEASEIITGKDTRGASKHQRKKIHSRKGKKIVARTIRKTPPPPPQPKRTIAEGNELVLPGDAIVLDWNEEAFDALFEGDEAEEDQLRGVLTHKEVSLFPDDDLIAKRAQRQSKKKNGISLDDCLNEFGKTETLSEQNAWYCPRCKEHRRAEKQFELWKVPDVLVMHLKRFSSSRNLRDKLEVKVDYPVEGLDMTPYVKDLSDGRTLIYDLIAVDNHYGGLGGGHYTAYAKNSVNGNWYDYNDSHVSQVKDPESVVSKSAYLLFYRRRSETPLGGPTLETVLAEADSEDVPNSRDASPSGEGQRLGDSSHNGLSSALAGQAHLVGDGGSAKQQKMKGLSQDQEGGGHSIYHGHLGSNDEELPSYENANSDMLLNQEDEGVQMIGPTLPWESGSGTWGFDAIDTVKHPTSNVDEEERPGFLRFGSGRRGSNASDAGASSTGGMGGSEVGRISDLGEDEMLHSFDDEKQPIMRRDRESAPPPEHAEIPEIHVPWQGADDDDDELEVQELRIASDSGDPANKS